MQQRHQLEKYADVKQPAEVRRRNAEYRNDEWVDLLQDHERQSMEEEEKVSMFIITSPSLHKP
jgi:hypothetical protein